VRGIRARNSWRVCGIIESSPYPHAEARGIRLDSTIIGAGPSGCYAAYLLAKNHDVNMFEEHKMIGKPVQCTGIVTSSLEKVLPFKLKDNTIINKINKARIFSPNKRFIELNLKNENLILDREKFDQFLADKAAEKGARIFLNHKFIGYNKDYVIIKDTKNNKIIKINNNKLIGADGPLSSVAKSNGLFKNKKFLIGVQVRAKLKNENTVEFYPFIGSFAWIVPEDNKICRIGVASYKNPKKWLDYFLRIKKINQIIEKQAGLIPIYNPKTKTCNKKTYLIGDAAGQLKATTGGGIIQGLTAAKCLANSINKNLNYEKEWRKKLGKDLSLHLFMHKMMNRFSPADWNYLINLFNKKRTKSTIENFDRDYPSKFILKLLMKEPRLIYFTKLIFHNRKVF